MIKPLFDYASIIWGDKKNSSLMDSLQVLQSRAAKIILDRDLFSSASDALRELKWIPLLKQRVLHRQMFVFKCVCGLVDFDLDVPAGYSVHNYNTRYKNNLRKPLSRRNWGLFRTNCHCVNDYNTLPTSIRQLSSYNSFKRTLKNNARVFT